MSYTNQEAWSMLINGTPSHSASDQALLDGYAGDGKLTTESVQAVICREAGLPPTSESVQQVLHTNLASLLGLSGPWSEWTIQRLLNQAILQGVTISQVLGLGGTAPAILLASGSYLLLETGSHLLI